METSQILPYNTKRFYVIRDPNRLDITGKPSKIMQVMYKPDKGSIAEEFCNIWEVKGWSPEIDGKWTINRTDICFKYEWWPGEYYHNSIKNMLDYFEENFHETSANKPD